MSGVLFLFSDFFFLDFISFLDLLFCHWRVSHLHSFHSHHLHYRRRRHRGCGRAVPRNPERGARLPSLNPQRQMELPVWCVRCSVCLRPQALLRLPPRQRKLQGQEGLGQGPHRHAAPQRGGCGCVLQLCTAGIVRQRTKSTRGRSSTCARMD